MEKWFEPDEKLYRAVFPPEKSEIFWKADGSLSSAAFADKRGLSVERGDYRPDEAVASEMRTRFRGRIVSVLVEDCYAADARVLYLPSRSSKYHSEIHGSETLPLLNKHQRRYLASHARIICDEQKNSSGGFLQEL